MTAAAGTIVVVHIPVDAVTVGALSEALADRDLDLTDADVVLALEGARCRVLLREDPGAAGLRGDEPGDGSVVEREVDGVIDGYRYDDLDGDRLAWVIVAGDAGDHEYVALEDVEDVLVWVDPDAVHAALTATPSDGGRATA